MCAERIVLETDHLGNLKNVPKFPPNQQVVATFKVVYVMSNKPSSTRRTPHPEIAGKTVISGDIFNSMPDADWDTTNDCS